MYKIFKKRHKDIVKSYLKYLLYPIYNKMCRLFVYFLTLVATVIRVHRCDTTVFVENDLMGKLEGDSGRIIATVEDSEDDVRYCYWIQPSTRKALYSDDHKDDDGDTVRSGIKVKLKRRSRRNYECTLDIQYLSYRDHNGPWEVRSSIYMKQHTN